MSACSSTTGSRIVELVQTLTAHVGRVWRVSWHPKGDSFASCGEDKTIRIWSKDGSKWVNKVVLTDGHKRTIRDVSWSPCGNYLAAASFDATTSIWDKKSGEFECNATLEGHENEVKSVAWSKSGEYLATCSRDKSVWVWEIVEDDEYECDAVLNAHTQDVKKVVWHPTEKLLASCSYDNTVKFFQQDSSCNEWVCSGTLQSHESTVWSIAFDKRGERLASVGDDKTLKIWKRYQPNNPQGIPTENENTPSWRCVCTLSGHHIRTIYDVSWCPLTNLIATACGDDFVRVFTEEEPTDPEAPTFTLCASECAHDEDVNCVNWNPKHAGLLASCSDNGEIKLWMVKCNQ